jgi:hypothetical protein
MDGKNREGWRLVIEIMDKKSIEKLSRTNKEFKKYIDDDSEYLYKKLFMRDYNCISGYKELYDLLEATKVRQSSVYIRKCVEEGYFNCDTLLSDFIKMTKNGYIGPTKMINMTNSIINCLEQPIRTPDAQKFINLLHTISDTLIRNNKFKKAKESKKWNVWFPIAMSKLESFYTPKRN